MRIVAVGQDAVGVFAFGQQATGVVAIGQLATGVIAVGQLARGIVVIGQLACGVVAFGQLGVGGVWAGGMLAIAPTSSTSLLGVGVLGEWTPWRGRRPRWALGMRRSLVLRVLVVVLVVALVTWVAVIPVADELVRPGGVFRDPASQPRLM
ncbi:MAG: hypothetical protein KDB21_02490 [Acidimicrobiales bacterium]|nr:hypothetical protein [Acidimicrobiales bacterium]